ncbi:hypothetical protein JTB14_034345 [Gonioctena quinquepunctata]|nr:hypothetical protein JTB14_034345 [Gonioctena quinquepunctata]
MNPGGKTIWGSKGQGAEAGETRPRLHRGQKSRNQEQLHPTGTKGSRNPKEGTGPMFNQRPSQKLKEGKSKKAKTGRHIHRKADVK